MHKLACLLLLLPLWVVAQEPTANLCRGVGADGLLIWTHCKSDATTVTITSDAPHIISTGQCKRISNRKALKLHKQRNKKEN